MPLILLLLYNSRYLIVKSFLSADETEDLLARSKQLLDDFKPEQHPLVLIHPLLIVHLSTHDSNPDQIHHGRQKSRR